jgi:sulfur-oxidizing protein SoxY
MNEESTMKLSRREAIALGLGSVAASMLPMPLLADAAEDAIAAFTGGAAIGTTGVTLTAPEIAENGNTVPVSVSAPGASAIMLLATGNPTPAVATFKFGPAAGSQNAATRIRLAKTQKVIAIAQLADGTFAQAESTVKVTIGGCGG